MLPSLPKRPSHYARPPGLRGEGAAFSPAEARCCPVKPPPRRFSPPPADPGAKGPRRRREDSSHPRPGETQEPPRISRPAARGGLPPHAPPRERSSRAHRGLQGAAGAASVSSRRSAGNPGNPVSAGPTTQAEGSLPSQAEQRESACRAAGTAP